MQKHKRRVQHETEKRHTACKHQTQKTTHKPTRPMGNQCRLWTAICHASSKWCGYPGLCAHNPLTSPITQRSRRTYNCGVKQPPHCDCYVIKKMYGSAKSGVYNVSLADMTHIQAYCDMETAGGGWTVFQRRQDGSVDFYRTWKEYKTGFGDPAAEHWLGNDNLYQLTNRNNICELYIILESWNNITGYARYSRFAIDDESNAYRLHVGNFTGFNVGRDCFRYHDSMKFTTKDYDNDLMNFNCASGNDRGAWWYNACEICGLNGLYNETSSIRGIEWLGFPGGSINMKFTQMMVRCE
ncbi:hypothetical protein FSP39_005688 [Pinctada imbricata]|uniref:Fibrinogen C-terminal domain-containing protein n=1 Tax=Pinctada imbricata TaxID=66713 RepID=A0AA89CBW7_PINIB|nr:hypothetical protein FSP39_005688 [Pinctada imbricata]